MNIKIDGKRVELAAFLESKHLDVKGYLYLRGTQITALPDNLTVAEE